MYRIWWIWCESAKLVPESAKITTRLLIFSSSAAQGYEDCLQQRPPKTHSTYSNSCCTSTVGFDPLLLLEVACVAYVLRKYFSYQQNFIFFVISCVFLSKYFSAPLWLVLLHTHTEGLITTCIHTLSHTHVLLMALTIADGSQTQYT